VYGTRDRLTKAAAKQSGKVWLETIAQHPRSVFCLSIAGYVDDPRPLHEFEEVRRYVRQWAKFAGITSPDSIKVEVDSNFFLIGC
jgi:FMN-dependent NADH-azoreductase